MKITRTRLDNGEVYWPSRDRNGFFRVGDPTLGKAQKLAENQVSVRTEEDLVSYIRRGFSVRMRGEKTNQDNLIAAKNIVISP